MGIHHLRIYKKSSYYGYVKNIMSQSSEDTPNNTETTPLVNCPRTKDENIEQARKILYISHFCAQFSEIGWQFCLILFLTALTNYRSLIFVSSYGLFTGMSSCLFGSVVGALIDDKQKKHSLLNDSCKSKCNSQSRCDCSCIALH